ncbi:MAG: Carbonate dehydratase [Actinomycetia bacterium]|nr:Carbonate dehydratase [Actinomycetes bacterium]
MVFLVAVPLSLGIAVASGAPVAAGLIAAVLGGIVAGAFGGSALQVSGPAAGLTMIVASLIQTYGWQATCAITLCAGLLQLLLSPFRVARTALAVSPAVVHGMMAGVGVILVLAQIHVMLGGRSQGSALVNLRELPGQVAAHHSRATLIGLLTIAVLLAWGRLRRPRIPGPLVAVAAGTGTAWALGWDVPRVDLPGSLLGGWEPPVVPAGSVLGIVGAVLSVAVVAGVESLLCSVALDRIRPPGIPRSDLDRELAGQGAANTLSGLLGGLPIAGVVVRSMANVQAGARSRASAVLHGAWVLILALSCGPVVEQIPLAALAALLMATGVRMLDRTHVRHLRHHREAPVYAVTLLGVVILGLGEGVLIGVAVAAGLALRKLTRLSLFTECSDGRWHVVVEGALTFLGVPRLTAALHQVPPGAPVDLDLDVNFMDHAAFEAIHHWRVGHERSGGRVDIDEIHESWYESAVTGNKTPVRRTSGIRWWAPWGARRRQPPGLDGASPRDVLLAGVREYHDRTARLVRPIMAELAFQQTPEHLFITCVDSRVVPNIITASGPGDLFIVRNVANLVPRHGSQSPDDSVAAAVEYATNVLDVRTITVCGHSHCGGMAGLLGGGTETDHLPALSRWLKHGNHSLAKFLTTSPPEPEEMSPLTRLCQVNVMQQLDNLMTYPWLRNRVESGRLELVGMFFELETAKVFVLDPGSEKFLTVPHEAPEDDAEDPASRGPILT